MIAGTMQTDPRSGKYCFSSLNGLSVDREVEMKCSVCSVRI